MNASRLQVRLRLAMMVAACMAGGGLRGESLRAYVEQFNADDEELVETSIPNREALAFLEKNVPKFECPDEEIERTYAFRWWTFRKHIRKTPDGYVITEFLPQVPWARKYNTICCPAGHHFREGRWLADGKILDDYARFYFGGGGKPRQYSFWAADSVLNLCHVRGDYSLAIELLDELVGNYREWEKARICDDGLFWQIDDRDGMEVSVGGSGKRPTINSYQFGDAMAIATIAGLAGRKELQQEFAAKGRKLRALVEGKLWCPEHRFYKTLPYAPEGRAPRKAELCGSGHVAVRELHGYTPWYFHLPLPDGGREVAWRQLMDKEGFLAPYGPTTTEQRHPGFKVAYEGHECQWNGPSWPFATSVTLTAMANVLHDYPQDVISKADYLKVLRIYTGSHRRKTADGKMLCWIDENLNPFTGDWISRTRLKDWKDGTWDAGKGGVERGKDYNHSTYCDLIISGLIGLRPRADNVVEVNPLVPAGEWDWFRLDGLPYHGRLLTILYDKTGTKYGKGKGFRIFVDGKEIAMSETPGRLAAELPPR